MLNQAFNRRDNRRLANAGDGNNSSIDNDDNNQNQLIFAPIDILRSKYIDYFDSFFEEDKDLESFVVNTNRHVFYRNVFVFINRLRDLTTKHISAVVTALIQGYLRDEALI